MEKSKISFTPPEAGIALATLVAFADDDPSEAEGVVMRRYYKFEDAEALQKKLSEAGYNYPKDLSGLKPYVAAALSETDEAFRLRALAVALEAARADGKVDQYEMNLLGAFAGKLQISLADAEEFARDSLKEIDETGSYADVRKQTAAKAPLKLTPDEAGIALAALVGFSDDDPSDAEAAVVRDNYDHEDVESLENKLQAAGYRWPEELVQARESILRTLAQLDRSEQLRRLAIAYKVATADGEVEELEIALLKSYCEELYFGLAELREYFKTSVV